MTRILTVAALPVLALMAWSPALAVDIYNSDDRDYEVTIISADEEGSSTFTLYAGGSEEGVCDACKIMIEGIGIIDADYSDTIEIVGGKLTKKPG